MKRITRSTIVAILILAMTISMVFILPSAASASINNSSLLPKWLPYDQVTVDENGTPDWVDSLIMMGCRISTATQEGTFQAATKVLDHCAEMGVNGLWITPIADNKSCSHGYYSLGVNTIDPRLTGLLGYDEKWRQTDYEQSWQIFKSFVDEAHKRNIRIILDVVSWGVTDDELVAEHPDWFQNGDGNGGPGNKNFVYDNIDAQNWYAQEVIKIVEKTGIDGLRYDMEPGKFGYATDQKIKKTLLDEGIKIVTLSEHTNERGDFTYDFEQWGVNGFEAVPSQAEKDYFVEGYNIVDCIKNGEYIGSTYAQKTATSGEYKYYTYMLSSHDFNRYVINKNKIKMGYQAIFTPFIPLWFIGEEWDNKQETMLNCGRGASKLLFGTGLDWSMLDNPENRAFYEEVKDMIRIRRTYPEIFNYWPDNHKETNICNVEVLGQDNLYSYARYAGNKEILVVPNDNAHKTDAKFKVYVPLKSSNLDYYESYTITDINTGKKVAEGTAKQIKSFTTSVEYGDIGLYLVTANGTRNVPKTEEEKTSDENITDDEYEEYEEYEYYYDDEDEDVETGGKKKAVITKHRKKRKNNDGDLNWWLIGGLSAGGLVVLGGGAFLLIFLLKRKKKKS